jgi:trehalose 6-phosphate synthase/phosphatase
VMQANKAIEIRVSGINKGTVAKEMIAVGAYDFILAIGDDATDEDLFAVLPEWAHSIKVGAVHSHARYNCRDVDDVHRLLSMLGDLSPVENVPSNVITRSLGFIERLTRKLSNKFGHEPSS